MRRKNIGFAVSISALVMSASLLLGGCGGGEETGAVTQTSAPAAALGMLRQVGSDAELETTLRTALLEGARDPAATVANLTGIADFSGTYTAEAGVDEFDHVRYDGTHLYVAPRSVGISTATRSLRILATDSAGGSAVQVGSIPLEGTQQVSGILVAEGRLVILTVEYVYPPYGGIWPLVMIPPTKYGVQVFDVNDPAHPARLLQATLDGAFVDTRRVGDRVYLVSRYRPLLREGTTAGDLLPKITIAGLTRPLIKGSDCYVTNEANTPSYPLMTLIISFSMQDPGTFSTTCYNEASNGIYASTTALYVSQPRSGVAGTTSTRIHKFAFSGSAARYAGSAEVPGALWTGGQNDFRINEYQGALRVITTAASGNADDPLDHRLFILRPRADSPALDVVATLPNASRPGEIGKPGEALYGVRFAGDRAYAVTFRQTDPLYVLDLANPEDPRIAGTVEIPGFSDFLHPVTQDLLLGLGTESGNIKLELFDVSVLEQPQSRGRILFDARSSSTEAQRNRHAFTWLAGSSMDRFAMTAAVSPKSQPGLPDPPVSSGLHQFEITGKQSAATASLRTAGVVTTGLRDNQANAASPRAFIHGDTVFYVRDGKVWSSAWQTPAQVRGPW